MIEKLYSTFYRLEMHDTLNADRADANFVFMFPADTFFSNLLHLEDRMTNTTSTTKFRHVCALLSQLKVQTSHPQQFLH